MLQLSRTIENCFFLIDERKLFMKPRKSFDLKLLGFKLTAINPCSYETAITAAVEGSWCNMFKGDIFWPLADQAFFCTSL